MGKAEFASDDIDDGMLPATAPMRRRGLFGRKVRLLRERLGLSLEEFAKTYDFASADVTDWERGRALPLPAVEERIEEIEARASMTTNEPRIS